MANALIGYTGFVGGTLERAPEWSFDARYNSRNIADIAGQSFDTVICAGVSAKKWIANADPAGDWAAIETLIGPLRTVQAKRFILISTIDVYPRPEDVFEDDRPDPADGQPYGAHRLQLERFVEETFTAHHIVRLPALFGDGLQKNALYDLLADNMIDKINPAGIFQWYPMCRLGADLAAIVAADRPLLNIAVEPVGTAEIVDRFFSGAGVGQPMPMSARYDMKTRYPGLLGGSGVYHLTHDDVIGELDSYIAGAKARGTP